MIDFRDDLGFSIVASTVLGVLYATYFFVVSSVLGEVGLATSLVPQLIFAFSGLYLIQFLLSEVRRKELQYSFSAGRILLLALPLISMFREVSFILLSDLILATFLAVSLFSLMEYTSNRGSTESIKLLEKYRIALVTGGVHVVLAVALYTVSTGNNILRLILESETNFLVYSMAGIFLLGSLPIYLYEKKQLKTPLAIFLIWLLTGVTLFFYNFSEYPLNFVHGGLALPPQPGYLMRPWLPLILILISWKLEESYRGENEDSA